MTEIHSCIRCLYTTAHPLGLTLDDEGVCSGCRIHEEKDTLDWAVRWGLLTAIVDPYRSKSGRNYDCIVPVTGGHDSHFIVHLVKEKLGLNPLLVTYNKYFNTPLGIRNLANLRIKFDCDILVQNVNPLSVKRITRTTLRRFGSIYWPCLAGQTVFPVQTAVRYKIPLIIWGAHQGLEQVGMYSHENEVEMTRRYRKDHDLMGYEADNLLTLFDTLKEQDIWQYRYPAESELEQVGVRGIYLGNYVRWDPKAQHELMVERYDYMGADFGRDFDTFDHVDCYNFLDLHDKLKLIKHGYSKVTDHACREIRHGRLTRSEGTMLVSHLQNKPLNHASKFLDWLGMTESGLGFVLDRHTNPDFADNPITKETGTEGQVLEIQQRLGFAAGSTLHRDLPDQYITVGKGWP